MSNLELTELKMDLANDISKLRTWTLFLQILGLTMIIMPDLIRKL